jgi:hypothetical protein
MPLAKANIIKAPWPTDTSLHLGHYPVVPSLTSMAFSPDKELFVCPLRYNGDDEEVRHHCLRILKRTTGPLVTLLNQDNAMQLAISPDSIEYRLFFL